MLWIFPSGFHKPQIHKNSSEVRPEYWIRKIFTFPSITDKKTSTFHLFKCTVYIYAKLIKIIKMCFYEVYYTP